MTGRLFVIFMIFLAGGCLAASSIGYLASIGPSPIRFRFLIAAPPAPEIDYNPKPLEIPASTNQTETIKTKVVPDTQQMGQMPLPTDENLEQQTQTQPPEPQPDSANQQSQQQNQSSTQPLEPNYSTTQVIPPQVFVNYFKQNPFLRTNTSTQVIVVPNFLPPPPAFKPSSSATYNIK